MSGAQNTLTVYGVEAANAARFSDGHATREALRVAAMADCTWPAMDEVLRKHIAELLITHLLSFAVHARRHLSSEPAEGVKVVDVSARLPKRANVQGFDGTLWRALQHILHAETLMVVPVETGHDIFTNAGDLRISHIQVSDEDGTTVYICPMGLSHAFLGRRAAEQKTS